MDRRFAPWSRILLLSPCALMMLAVPPPSASAQSPRYTATWLNTLGGNLGRANAINAAGDVTGLSFINPYFGDQHAFLWRQGRTSDLGALPGSTRSVGLAINASDLVAGWSSVNGQYRACTFSVNGVSDLGTLPGDIGGEATGVNDSGLVVGFTYSGTYTINSLSGQTHAFQYQNGTMTALPVLPGYTYSQALAVNNSGQISGFCSRTDATGTYYTACLWQNGVATDLGGFGSTTGVADALNDLGQIAGYAGGTSGTVAIAWPSGPSSAMSLGLVPGAASAKATGINHAGQVVGSYSGSGYTGSFFWSSATGALDLQSLIADPTVCCTTGSYAINDAGQVAGGASGLGVLLSPIPTGSTSLVRTVPTSVDAGITYPLLLNIYGAGFTSGTPVYWNGSPLATQYSSSTLLYATVPTSLTASPGVAQVTVGKPDGSQSNYVWFTIYNAPILTSLSPSSALVGSSPVTVTLNGSNFTPTSQVYEFNQALSTTYVSPTQLAVTISASDLATAQILSLTVFTPGDLGGKSQYVYFYVNNPTPSITNLDPSQATVGRGDLTLTVTGSGFSPSSTIFFNGGGQSTTYISPTQLQAYVPSGNFSAAGSFSVTVSNPSPGGGMSAAANFVVNNAAPTLVSVSPAIVQAGGPAYSMGISGSGFIGGAPTYPYNGYSTTGTVAYWNGSPLATRYDSPTHLTADVPASLIASAGTASITAVNPAPGGGASNALPVTVQTSAAPITLSFAPASISGGASSTGTVTLNQPAPNLPGPAGTSGNGAYVQISDDQTSVVSVGNGSYISQFVYIPAGQTTGTFTVQAQTVYSTVAAHFTAQFASATAAATLTVTPFTLSSLTLDRSVVGVGGHTTATLTLSGPAPSVSGGNYPGYLYVQITSSQASTTFSNANFQGGGGLLIPVGATSATFDVTPGPVSVDTPITITASYGQTNKSATFTAQTTPPDTTAPVTTLSLSGNLGNSGWYIGPATVTLSATDPDGTQDIAATYYTIDGVQYTYTAPVAISADGAHTVTYWSVDFSGNVEAAHTQAVDIDQTPPVFAFGAPYPAPNAAGWNNSEVHIPYTASDAASGIAASWPGVDLDFSSEGSGQQSWVYAIDVAGNMSAGGSPIVNIDLSPPVTTATGNGSQLTLSASDAISGVAATYYTIDGGARQTYSSTINLSGVGAHSVSYWSVDVAGNVEAAQTYGVTVNPAPSLTGLNPSSIAGGGPDFTLTVTGSNFVASSQVLWNGTALATTYVSATQLTATVPAANIATDGSAHITVSTPAPGGGVSGALTFTINTPQSISSISPGVIYSGSPDTTVYVSGAGFVSGSSVTWNGTALATTFVSSSNLTAVIPASDLATVGTASVAVSNPGFKLSNALPMYIVASQPQINYTSPNYAIAGGAAFTLYVAGAQFQPGDVISWNGTALATTYQSSVVLTAPIPASYIATAGSASIVVTSPSGAASNTFAFPINNYLPILQAITPSTVNAGSGDITLVASGGQMTPVSTICWNGTPLPTTYIDGSKVSATIPASKLTTPGTASITVTAPAPGGGTSSALTFTIAAGHPPVTTANLSGTLGANGWYTSAVQVALSATDPDGPSDVAATYYTLDGGVQQTYTAPFSISASGTHTVAYWSVDKSGNTETQHTQTVKIDTAAPVTTSAVSGNQVTLSATDAVSGVAATYDTIDGGAQQTYSSAIVVTAAGTHTVSYWSVDNAGNTETAHTATVTNASAPTLTAISPSSAPAGSASRTLTATGSNFTAQSQIQWNGSALTTTYVSATSLTATIPASLLASYGTASVKVVTPAPGGGTSAALTFAITDATAPVTTASVSGAQVTLTATDSGSGVAATYYTIDSGARQTYSAPFTVTGSGTHTIAYWSVDNAGNTETSHSVSVTINAVPTLSAISPATATAGASALTLTATGSGFVSGAVVKWNGTALTTTYVSATSLTAAVPASLLASAGTASVTVTNPAPGGGTSAAQTFTITAASAGYATVSALVTSGSGPYFSEEQVNLSSTKTITALSVTITIQKTAGVRYQGEYGNFPGNAMTVGETEDASKIVYTYVLKSGQTLNANSNWLSAAQIGGNGTAHPYSGDTYSVNVTSNGVAQTFSGHF